MKKTIFKTVMALLILVIINTNVMTVAASKTSGKKTAEKTTEKVAKKATVNKEKTKEETAPTNLIVNPEDASDPVMKKPELVKTSYNKEFLWASTITLKGIYSTESLYFNIPKYWHYKYIYAEIQYDLSQLIDGVPASLTFSVNGNPISSTKVDYQNGKSQTIYVKIPTGVLRVGYNVFDVSGYVRLYDDEGCLDEYSGANWININKNSYISVGYDVMDHNNYINSYPYPFVSTMEPEGSNTEIFVSDSMDNSELAAAMYLMADLSNYTEEKTQIKIGTLSEIEQTKATNKIVISKTENLNKDLLSFVDNPNDLSDKALVKFVEDRNGEPLLLIVSNDEESLTEAVFMLMDEDRVFQEKTSTTYVNKGSGQQIQSFRSQNELVAGTYTLKDLIGNGLNYKGPFHQNKVITLPLSSDFIMAEGGKVTLKYRYSENLDFNRSLITVYWGDVPVASKKLLLENATGDELTFSFPADVIGTSGNTISIAFELEIPDLFCSPRQEEMPWAYITEDSTFYFPKGKSTAISFDIMPTPFQNLGTFSDLMLIVSDKPTMTELNVLAHVIAMYGESINPYGSLKVKRASEFNKEDANYNIITAGTYESNKFLQLINGDLSFGYSTNGDKFESNEGLILSDSFAAQIAVLQLIQSPFIDSRAILAVGGTDETNLSYVEELLQIKKNRWNLSKDSVIIDSDLNTKSYEFLNIKVSTMKPTIKNVINENKDSIIFTVVSTAVMLILLLTVVIILIRIKTFNKKGKG